MAPFSKILFPVDFSKRCQGAAHAVRAMAMQFQAEVTALHVVEAASANSAYENLVGQAREKMDALVAQDLSGCVVAPCFEAGDPVQIILSYARNGHFDLIMLPTHGYGAFRRFLLGSVAAKILHDAGCPVWTSAHLETWPATENLGIRKVMAAIDFGPRSSAVLQLASQVAGKFQAGLTVAHVIPISSPLLEGYWIQEWRDEARKGALQQIQKLLCAAKPPPEIEVLEGSPAWALSDAADRLNADLVVIGRTHASEHGGQLGANAYAIIARSPCPVLSV
jgi:nucleotide-binding universal stress UspA family protein